MSDSYNRMLILTALKANVAVRMSKRYVISQSRSDDAKPLRQGAERRCRCLDRCVTGREPANRPSNGSESIRLN